MLNQFSNLSCYEEFEIQCALTGISKTDVLNIIGYQIDDYYFFISEDGIFNWYDLNGNYVENPGILKYLKYKYIPKTITKCIIPNSITHIGAWTFADCKSLKEITIPNSVICINNKAFYYCISLTEITISDSVTNIGDYTFSGCILLTSISISNSVTNIGNYAFYYCKSLKEITIPDSVTRIGISAFWFCEALKEVIFKGKTLDQVKQMENYPFGIEDESIIKCEI